MGANSYRAWQALGQPTPRWLQRPNGSTLVQGFGQMKDDVVATARAATKARFPYQDLGATQPAPTDALAAIGRDRVLARYPGDTDATYAARLVQAFATWSIAGTAKAITTQLKAAGFPNAQVYPSNTAAFQAGQVAPVAPWPPVPVMTQPSWWAAQFPAVPWPPAAGDHSWWSLFWVWITPPFPFDWRSRAWGGSEGTTTPPNRWGSVLPSGAIDTPDGTPYTWGSTATAGQVALVRSIVSTWKGAHETCANIVVTLADSTRLYWDGV